MSFILVEDSLLIFGLKTKKEFLQDSGSLPEETIALSTSLDPNANWENIFRYAPISANQVDYPYTVSFRYALMRFGYPHMRLHFPITHDSFMQIRKIQAHIRGYLTPLFIINTIEGVGENYPIIIIIIF